MRIKFSSKRTHVTGGFWRNLALGLWVAGFVVGGLSHLADIAVFGWLPYTHVPAILNAFFTALLPLDFLVAALILVRPRAGLLLGLAVLTGDILANAWVIAQPGIGGWHWRYSLIGLFALFVVLTLSWLLRAGVHDQATSKTPSTSTAAPSGSTGQDTAERA